MAHILEKELQDLAASSTSTSGKPSIWDIQTSGNAAVTFSATREGSLCALCWLRTAHRILELIASTEDHDDDENNNNNNNNNKSGTYYIRTRDDIHDFIHERIDVKELLGDGRGGLLTLSVKAILNNPRDLPQDVSHSHYTALTVKNALCDIVRELHHDGIRPDVDLDDPDVPLVVILKGEQLQQVPNQRQQRGRQGTPDGTTSGRPANDGRASLSLYRSLHPPGSLHRRGYRRGQAIHKAAMKETMAAGLLLEAGWLDKVNAIKQCDSSASSRMSSDPQSLQMIDPMCGSGSLCLEAAMMAADIAPSLMRIRCGMENHSTPPVTRWKPPKITVQPRTNHESSDRDHSASRIWKEILLDATQRAKRGIQFLRKEPRQIQIWGNDIHDGALDIAESALSSAGLASFVTLTNEDCYDLDLKDLQRDGSSSRHIVVATNPPWGVRLTDDVADSWEGLRHFIRDSCPSGTEVWVLSGDKVATSALKLKRDRMIPIQTGDQHLRWIKYTIRGLSDNSSTDSPSRHRQKDGWEMQERTIKPQQQVLQKRKTTNNPTTGKNEWM
jgi:23S rRNA G2445 N2-methylase RlmL